MNTSQTTAAERGTSGSRSAASRVQAKLSVGRARDGYEQEADRVAAVVVGGSSESAGPASAAGAGVQRMPAATAVAGSAAPRISRLTDSAGLGRVSRQGEEEEAQAKIQREEEEKEATQSKLQRQEEEEAQAKIQREEEEEATQSKLQRQEEEEAQAKIQREEEEEEATQSKLQRQEEEEAQAKIQREEEEEATQSKLQRQEEEEAQAKIQRQEEEEAQAKIQREEEEEEATQSKLQRKGNAEEEKPEPQAAEPRLPEADVGPMKEREREEKSAVQTKMEPRANVRDKRQYPVLDRVEGKLFENKGKGEPMPDETRVEMEAGFRADFGKVRIHTGGDAVAMSRELRAQAFTHGSDVFFNSGKFEPESVRGKTLLAHELTHVVQQGAAEQSVPESKVRENNAKKNEAPPEPADKSTLKVEQETKQTIEAQEPKLGEAKEASAGAGGAPAGAEPAAADEAAPAQENEAEPGKEAGAEGGEADKAPGAEAKAPGKSKGGKSAKKGAGIAAAKGGLVGDFLRKMTKAAFKSKMDKVSQLATNQKKKTPPEGKLAETEKAVVPPAEEGASRSKAGQVETVEQAKPPEPDEAKAKEDFDSSLERAVPTTLEEVDKFKEEGKGRLAGQAVKGVVTADAQEVKGTYQEIDNPPEPAPPEQAPETLPEVEAAPETAQIDMGDGVVGEVQPEQTDLSDFDQESDQLLEKEGINEEQLEMVDEGELAEAKQDRKSVKAKTKEGPAEVKAFEKQQKQQVDKDLKKDEQEGRQKMKAERDKGLAGTKDDQTKTKTKLEQKREAVTARINGIYEKANTTVKQKLEDLEKKSMKDFDDGEKKATKSFEDNVKRRIDAYKRRRYDRVGGSLLWAKDKLFGMDELPEVKNIFDSEKSGFITAIDGLIKTITAENKRVIQECKDIVAQARVDIQTFVDGLGPELQQTGQDALKEMKSKLDALDKQVADKEKELQKKLAEKREAAIKAIEEKIEKMKEEMSGLVSKLGNLLLNAMVKFFKWALKKAGYASDQLMGILNKGQTVIKKIVGDPIAFIGNIVKAVKNGIGLFVTNIKKHLIGGLISWLTGAMADVPITLPTTWDLKGILSLVLQILGLTWDIIRQKLVKRVGEKVVRVAETTIDIVKRIVTEGPIALWNMIKEKAAEIKQQVMDGIRNWVIVQVVKQAVIKLVSFLNPAGAIVQAILAIYNTIMFFVENWDRIVQFVKTVFGAIADIAMGKLSAVAQAVEKALAMTVPIILGFLARLIGLSGIGKAVSNIIKKIRKPIDKVVDKVLDKVVAMAKKLLKKAKQGAGKLKDQLLQWWKARKTFTGGDGKSHNLYYKGKGKTAKLMLASSNPSTVPAFLEKVKPEIGKLSGKKKSKMERARSQSAKSYADIEQTEQQLDRTTDRAKQQGLQGKIQVGMNRLAGQIKPLLALGAADVPPAILPPMVFGVKARSFTAEYINKDVKDGTEASSYDGGTMPGWGTLDPALKKPGRFVKMHLLPHRLGGDAADSNLVAASGPDVNVPFSHGMEKAAIKAKQDGEVVWYKMQVGFHSGPAKNYPSSLVGKWGTYRQQNNSWEKQNKPGGQYQKTGIAVPALRTTLEINAPDTTAGHIGSFLEIDRSFAMIVLSIRKSGVTFTGPSDVVRQMRLRHQRNIASGQNVSADFDTRLAKLEDGLRRKASFITF